MLKDILYNYLTSNSDPHHDSIVRTKFMILNSFTVIGVSFVFIFGIFNILRQFYPLGVVEIFGGWLCIGNVLLLRRTKNIDFAGSVILFLMQGLFVALLLFGSNDRTGLFWFFTYPLLALFLKGYKIGFICTAIQILITIAIISLSEAKLFFTIPYTLYEIIVLCCSLVAETLIVLFYEIIRNELAANLKKQLQETVGKKILEDQFAIAEKIQRLLIPGQDHVFNNLEISGYYRPAAGVGGDYYDYFEIDKSNIAVIVCDVSGKGISGAFVMVNIRSIFQHEITRDQINPAEMVRIINKKMMSDLTNDMFATLSVYMYNSAIREVTFCNAGYGPFTYFSREKNSVLEIPFNSLPSGIIDDDSRYVNKRFSVNKGDVIVSYTDGLIECFERKYDDAGKQTLYDLISTYADKSAAEIKNRLINDVSSLFGKTRHSDDVSLIISKII
jgi:serine phosphatase RsbU (regulator of sigma subunit)